MATVFTCDRCGSTCRAGSAVVENVTTGIWKELAYLGDSKRAVVVKVEMKMPDLDGDAPDLCIPCRIDVMSAVIHRLGDRFREENNEPVFKVQMHVLGQGEAITGWHDGFREDIDKPEQLAEFVTIEECMQYAIDMRGMIHAGAGDYLVEFRIVRIATGDVERHEQWGLKEPV